MTNFPVLKNMTFDVLNKIRTFLVSNPKHLCKNKYLLFFVYIRKKVHKKSITWHLYKGFTSIFHKTTMIFRYLKKCYILTFLLTFVTVTLRDAQKKFKACLILTIHPVANSQPERIT